MDAHGVELVSGGFDCVDHRDGLCVGHADYELSPGLDVVHDRGRGHTPFLQQPLDPGGECCDAHPTSSFQRTMMGSSCS